MKGVSFFTHPVERDSGLRVCSYDPARQDVSPSGTNISMRSYFNYSLRVQHYSMHYNYSVAGATGLTRKSSSFNRLRVYLILMYVHGNELLHCVQFRPRALHATRQSTYIRKCACHESAIGF